MSSTIGIDEIIQKKIWMGDQMPILFSPIRIGGLVCPNRIFMAPVTRARGTKDHVPTRIMAKYYAQRAGAGLIISEAIGVSKSGLGWPFATGLWSEEQVSSWREITDAVHNAGGRIVAQIWHMGRMVHPSFVSGRPPISASATTAPGRAHTYEGRARYVRARPASVDEIKGRLAEEHVQAAYNAIRAGFDGVQIHAANGYLLDQFLRDGTNHREDEYGGTVENRLRILREVTKLVVSEIGADRTSVRISPNGDAQGVNDSDPLGLFVAAGKLLDELGVSFLEIRESPRDGTLFKGDCDPIAPEIRKVFSRPLVWNSDLDGRRAREILEVDAADAVSFGRYFISNPDLPERLRRGVPLMPYDTSAFYGRGEKGYTDYPDLT